VGAWATGLAGAGTARITTKTAKTAGLGICVDVGSNSISLRLRGVGSRQATKTATQILRFLSGGYGLGDSRLFVDDIGRSCRSSGGVSYSIRKCGGRLVGGEGVEHFLNCCHMYCGVGAGRGAVFLILLVAAKAANKGADGRAGRSR
jgi:hypothetical protein